MIRSLPIYSHQPVLQPPVPIPNIQAEANQVAKEVMKEINGTDPSPTNIGSPPTTAKALPSPRASSKPYTTDVGSSTNKTVPSARSSSRSRASESSNTADQQAECLSCRTGVGRSSDFSSIDTNKWKQIPTHDEELSSKSLALRSRSRSVDRFPGITEGFGRRDRDEENRPLSGEDGRSSSVVRVSGGSKAKIPAGNKEAGKAREKNSTRGSEKDKGKAT